MKRTLLQTPDGRVIRGPEQDTEAETAGHSEPALRAILPFIQACQSVLPDGPMSGAVRTGLFLFLLGAADRLWQRLELGDGRFPAFATALLQRQGVSAAEAATLVDTLPQLMQVEFARAAFLEGSRTLDEWQDAHDANSVMRLEELIARWRHIQPE